jgi:hypothetical protein
MFDLEKSIAEWRKQMLGEGIKSAAVDELESHLRQEIDKQARAGNDAASAFNFAVDQIGRTVPLKEEFAKAGETGWEILQKFKRLFGFASASPPFVEDWDPVSKRVLDFADRESRDFHHDFIGTEHVLLGLIKLESGIVCKILRRLGVEDKAVRAEVEKFVPKGPTHEIPPKIPYTPRVNNALRLAGREARALNRERIGPEHIFLGLILEGDGVAWRALKNLGIRIEDARRELHAEMGENLGAA